MTLLKGVLLTGAVLACGITAGCQDAVPLVVAGKVSEAVQVVRTVKAKGCDQLTDAQRALAVRVAKAYVPAYPPGGICQPDWVQQTLWPVLAEKLAAGD
ncbi:MAG: hypothetical protein OIF57_11735 [Marinobacterium sp.]|nr:hypothetical protein [Marinobacterium sp.]